MIQDIYPSILKNEFVNCEIKDEDYLLIFNKDGKIAVAEKEGSMCFPLWSEVKTILQNSTESDIRENCSENPIYLFAVDEQKYFLSLSLSDYQKEGFVFHTIREVRDLFSGKEV